MVATATSPNVNTSLEKAVEAKLSSPPQPKRWIYGPARDFWLIHGGIGLVSLPIVAASFLFPASLSTIIVAYTLLLGFPHFCATHVRLHLDQDCRERHRWLVVAAPLAVATLVAVAIFSWNLLPVLVLGWYLLQTWHANRQNFGIMRRYIRMSGTSPNNPVNRLAEAGIEILPWAAVTTALMVPNKTYQGYPIFVPPSEVLTPLLIGLWGLAVFVTTAYIAFEAYEFYKKRSVPGRILCFLSGALINITAWVLVSDIIWGYLVVSVWHALQYVSYVHAFRSSPPPGANVLKLSLKPHLGLLFVAGLTLHFLLKGMNAWIPTAMVVIHLSMNFHHYLADAFIWKAPKPAVAK